MKILLPTGKKTISTKSTNEPFVFNGNLVIIGANGSGKTRLGAYISQINIKANGPRFIHISAQKSLKFPTETTISPSNSAGFKYNWASISHDMITSGNAAMRTNGIAHQSVENFEQLLTLLFAEESDVAIAFRRNYNKDSSAEKPITKLDILIDNWEKLIPHRKLIVRTGSILAFNSIDTDVKNNDVGYNATNLSDGERIVFYLLGSILLAPSNAIIIIDEPELHLHKAIVQKLWNSIEAIRQDCTFIYITHDIDFAFSRSNAVTIWTREFNGKKWDYEVLDNNSPLPEALYFEILGSRNSILFIEGDFNSVDYKLLPHVFPSLTIKPLGSCQKVLDVTSAFNNQREFHQITSYGLIDRDRMSDEDIAHIATQNIWIANVSEIENFLLLENVVRVVATAMHRENIDVIFEQVKHNIISFFSQEITRQALEHTMSQLDRRFQKVIDMNSIKDCDALERSLQDFLTRTKGKEIFEKTINRFQCMIEHSEYNDILQVFNNKGIIYQSKVSELCGLLPKNGEYLNFIIQMLKYREKGAEIIRKSIVDQIRNCNFSLT